MYIFVSSNNGGKWQNQFILKQKEKNILYIIDLIKVYRCESGMRPSLNEI